jgi:hypothetical protein
MNNTEILWEFLKHKPQIKKTVQTQDKMETKWYEIHKTD